MKVLDWSKMPKGVPVLVWDAGELSEDKRDYIFIRFAESDEYGFPAIICESSQYVGEICSWECAELREQEQFTYWPGGECPLPDGVMVEVVYRNRDRATVAASSFRWSHVDEWDSGYGAYDIIAYRILGLADGWKYPHEVENET